MKRFSLLGLMMMTAALGCGGCSHIPFIGKKKNPTEPKQSKYIATDVEKEFEARWTEKRSAELISQGQASDVAKTQAEKEFIQKFPATTLARTPNT
jgi:hypothetical protein